METKHAIELAGSREKLALILGVASITTYRWTFNLPPRHEGRLRLMKPGWFRVKKAKPAAALDGTTIE